MLKNIRQFIKNIILELHGNQLSINDLSKSISEDVLTDIKRNFDKINDGDTWNFVSQTKTFQNIKKDTRINRVETRIDFKYSNNFKIDGNFKPDKTILTDDDNYYVVIKLELETDTLEGLLPKLESFMSHELNHAFVYIKSFQGKSKAQSLNLVNKLTQGELANLLKQNPALREFTNMIYLSNPYEVQARVQQTASELNYINSKNAEETMETLLKYHPLRDAKLMIAYKLDEIKKLDKGILETFVKKFNDNIRTVSKHEGAKTIYDIDKFFKYWTNIINISGDTLAKKIYKLVADKLNIHEVYFVYQQTDEVYRRVFGEYF